MSNRAAVIGHESVHGRTLNEQRQQRGTKSCFHKSQMEGVERVRRKEKHTKHSKTHSSVRIDFMMI